MTIFADSAERIINPDAAAFSTVLANSTKQEFELAIAGGKIETSYVPALGAYEINWVETYHPRQKLGKTLLGAALEHAHDLQAARVWAFIDTRQCYESMASVFGAEHITGVLGEYATKRQVDATAMQLEYPLYAVDR